MVHHIANNQLFVRVLKPQVQYVKYHASTFPSQMTPGDSLVSSISAEGQEGLCFMKLRKKNSFTKTFSILTCLDAPAAPDAFRPGMYQH